MTASCGQHNTALKYYQTHRKQEPYLIFYYFLNYLRPLYKRLLVTLVLFKEYLPFINFWTGRVLQEAYDSIRDQSDPLSPEKRILH